MSVEDQPAKLSYTFCSAAVAVSTTMSCRLALLACGFVSTKARTICFDFALAFVVATALGAMVEQEAEPGREDASRLEQIWLRIS